jgi:hypothetical protein
VNPSVIDPDREPSPKEVQLAVLERIHTAIENELVELEHARVERPVNAVAWISRNLVELCIWAQFCLESPENARSFFDDAARDSLEMLKMPNGLFARDPTYSFQAERERIIKGGKGKGVDGLEGSPAGVSKAAQTTGSGVEFKWTNKFLSKFAHPTALWIMTPYEEFEKLRSMIYEGGVVNGNDALRLIERFAAGMR